MSAVAFVGLFLSQATASDPLAAASAAESATPTEEAGGTLANIISSLPSDPASIFALLLLVGCTLLVLRYGLQKGHTDQKVSDGSTSSTAGDSPKR